MSGWTRCPNCMEDKCASCGTCDGEGTIRVYSNKEDTEMRTEISRAAGIINQMAPYVRKMAVPADFFAALNEHWLYMEKFNHANRLGKYAK